MKTIDTRDLYTRKCELEELRDAVTAAREKLDEAKEALSKFDPDQPNVAPDDEAFWEKAEELQQAVEEAQSNLASAESDFGPDEQEELAELETLESEISDFRHGGTMIPERDFEAYAQDLAEDTVPGFRDARWPFTCIDWEQAARELAMDYTSVTYQGDDYLVRA